MKRIVLLTIICILILPIHYLNVDIVLSDLGTSYYVANDGDDSNDGLSPSTPWRTIAKVNSEMNGGVVQNGDNVYFERDGTWSTGDYIILRRSGTESNRMILGAYGTGDKPVISGGMYGIVAEASMSYVTIQNFTIQGVSLEGVRFWRGSPGTHVYNHITFSHIDVSNVGENGMALRSILGYNIDNCTISYCGNSGLVIYGSADNRIRDGIIRDCLVHDITSNDCYTLHRRGATYNQPIGPNHVLINCSGYAPGEEVFDITSGTNIIMKDCEAWGKYAISVNHDVENLFIDNCYFHDHASNKWSIHTDWVTYMTVRNSIFYNYGRSAIGLDDGNSVPGPGSHIYFAHNTLVAESGASSSDYHVDHFSNCDYTTWKNNIFTSLSSSTPTYLLYHRGSTLAGTHSVYDTNMWYRSAGTVFWSVGGGGLTLAQWLAQSEVTNDVVDDPELSDPANGDFSLKNTSPCIDAGTSLTTTNGGGTGTVITVDESRWFHDGFGLIDGDNIVVGTDEVTITDIDYSNDQITINASITWNDGDPVYYSFNGSAPDIGAYEYASSIGPNSDQPEITNVVRSESDPLDTNASFGWINISATVTSDSGVNKVMCNVSLSNGSNANFSMGKIGSNTYYYNTSTIFSNNGSYSYYIWANDTNGNASISSVYDFSMPPNWDINNDGQCNVLDLNFISNHYGEIGQNGWIREDVDNNGIVQVFDFIMVTGHNGETW